MVWVMAPHCISEMGKATHFKFGALSAGDMTPFIRLIHIHQPCRMSLVGWSLMFVSCSKAVRRRPGNLFRNSVVPFQPTPSPKETPKRGWTPLLDPVLPPKRLLM